MFDIVPINFVQKIQASLSTGKKDGKKQQQDTGQGIWLGNVLQRSLSK
jgi:hypothetical protein